MPSRTTSTPPAPWGRFSPSSRRRTWISRQVIFRRRMRRPREVFCERSAEASSASCPAQPPPLPVPLTSLHLPRNLRPNLRLPTTPGYRSASRPESRLGRPAISRPLTRSGTSFWARGSFSKTRPRACAGRGSLDTDRGFQVYSLRHDRRLAPLARASQLSRLRDAPPAHRGPEAHGFFG